MAQRTPLYDRHVALGAAMVEFAGYDMPVQYSNMRDEHTAVRQRAGLFDVSHMGRLSVSGEGSLDALQRLVTNNVARLQPMQSLYTVMCTDEGGIIDDLIVIAGGTPGTYYIVVNASTRAKDVAWMQAHLDASIGFDDFTEDSALLALQGPRAIDILQPLSSADLSSLKPFQLARHEVEGVPARMSFVSRTGYTGEDGFELFVDAGAAPALWDALMDAGRAHGLLPCGLGARDTLRLEAGLRLYGQDMDEQTDPYSVGLGWTVKLDKQPPFIGADALRRIKENGAARRFAGMRMAGRAIARHGMQVLHGDDVVGEVTSGTYSFTLGHGIATALLHSDVPADAPLQVDIRGTRNDAEQVPLPFYKRPST